MAEIKALNKIVASSKDNFLIFSNQYADDKPFVRFVVSNGFTPSSTPKITIEDRFDDTYKREIVGTSGGSITSESFGFFSDGLSTAFSLLECLKKNDIFFNPSFNISGNSYSIDVNIDTSRSYRITSNDVHIIIGGNYINYSSLTPDRFVLLEKANIDNSTTQISLEKNSNSNTVSFNTTSSFQGITFKNPIAVQLLGYQIHNNKPEVLPISTNNFYVLPTTLSKFQDIDFNDYYYENATKAKKSFLTNRHFRRYNYGEYVSLSFLSDVECSLLVKYYTNGGSFIKEESVDCYTERNLIRSDFYATFDIESVEEEYEKQVGYFEVYAINGTNIASNAIKFTVLPRCNENRTIFFVNEIGGIDSYNFLGEYTYSSDIDDLEIYRRNPIDDFDNVKVIAQQRTKRNVVVHTLTTGLISEEDVLWLNELNKSKYIFLYSDEGVRYTVVIPEENGIEITDREDNYEITFSYREGDNFNLV